MAKEYRFPGKPPRDRNHPVVKALRARGLTQRWLAAQIGIDENSLSSHILGKTRLTAEHVLKAVQAMRGHDILISFEEFILGGRKP